jgi:single-strand DNA-binding protein
LYTIIKKEKRMNNVVLIGRLTRDPEVRYTGEQMAVASFSLAIDRSYQPKDGEKQTDFPRVITFGKTAELCERYLVKGRMVAVLGSIRTGSYKNKEGVTVYTTDVAADRVQFLDWGDKAGRGSEPAFGQEKPQYERPQAEKTFGGGFQAPDLPEGFTALDDDEDIPF